MPDKKVKQYKDQDYLDVNGLNHTVSVGESWHAHLGKSAKVHHVQFKKFTEELIYLKFMGKLGIEKYRHKDLTLIEK